MKPFAVVRYTEEHIYEVAYRARQRLGDQGDCLMYLQYNDKVEPTADLRTEQVVFWFNSLIEAEKFLSVAQERFPNNTYVLLQSMAVAYTEPGPIKIAKFTEQGLMPA